MTKITEQNDLKNFIKSYTFKKYSKIIQKTEEELKNVLDISILWENSFDEEKKQIIEKLWRIIVNFYEKQRKFQKIDNISLPSSMHYINVLENTKILFSEINSNKKYKDFFKLHINSKTFFKLTILALLHDFIEDFYKIHKDKKIKNFGSNIIVNYGIKDILSKNFSENEIKEIISILESLNLIGGLNFDKNNKKFDKESLQKLKKYIKKITKNKYAFLIKLADLLDNTWGELKDKIKLKYSYYLFYFYLETSNPKIFSLLNKIINVSNKDYTEFKQIIDKLKNAIIIYEIYKEIGIEKSIPEEQFIDQLLHFVAFIDKKDLDKIIKNTIDKVLITYENISNIYGGIGKIENFSKLYRNFKNTHSLSSIREKIEKTNLTNDKLFIHLFGYILIYGINYLHYLENFKNLEVKNTNKKYDNFIKINQTGNEIELDLEKTTKEKVELIINDIIQKINITPKKIKGRFKTGESIIAKLIREPQRWKEINEYNILMDQIGIAIIFNTIQDAQKFAKSLKQIEKETDKLKILDIGDRGLLKYKLSDKEEFTTIQLPFCNFKLGIKVNDITLPIEISIRPSSIQIIEEKINNIKKKEDKISFIINQFEPLEHNLYKAIEYILALPKLNNFLNFEYSKYKDFEKIIKSIINYFSEEVIKTIESNSDIKKIFKKYINYEKNKNTNKNTIKKTAIKLIHYKLRERYCKKLKNERNNFSRNIKQFIEKSLNRKIEC